MARDVNVGPAAEKKLERYGVWVKVEPREVSPDSGGGFQLSDLEPQDTPPQQQASALTDEEETLLDELETGVGHEVAAGTQDELASLDERIEAGDELPELELEDAVEVPLADDAPGAGRFDDLETLADDAAPAPADARQPEVLSRIEIELRSIRSDLAALKQELADLRRPAAAPAGRAAAAAGRAAAAAHGAGARQTFFEEEDDDTIALTGDELDNILNTADITEETAEAAASGADLAEVADLPGIAAGEAVDADEDLLPYEEPAAAAAATPAAVEAVAVEEPLEELEEISDIDLESTAAEPATLVLEDVGGAPAAGEALPSLDLEPIPEIETTGEAGLGELPAEEAAADGDLVADIEEVTTDDAEAPASLDDMDLKALGDAEETGHEAILSTDDLAASDLAELEAVAEEVVPAGEEGIEIEFEPAAPAAAEPKAGRPAPDTEEPVLDLEEIETVEELEEAPAPAGARAAAPAGARAAAPASARAAAPALVMNDALKNDLRKVLGVIDELLDALPEKKIREFAKSEHFAVYKKLFDDLGLSKPE